MAGVKRFEESEVLDRAMRLFWERGYEATSIQDLLDATGLNRGSLYATFGDKRRLFLAAVDRYMQRMAAPMFEALADDDPRRAIGRMFDTIIDRTRDRRLPRGCLITNTAIDCRRLGGQINAKTAQVMKLQEAAIHTVVRRAQAAGRLGPTEDGRALAQFFLAVAQGLNVVNKAGGETAVLKDIARVAMLVWPESRSAPARTQRLLTRTPRRSAGGSPSPASPASRS
jgi:TetR/AcrR family transcriptional repressor of nem operon